MKKKLKYLFQMAKVYLHNNKLWGGWPVGFPPHFLFIAKEFEKFHSSCVLCREINIHDSKAGQR